VSLNISWNSLVDLGQTLLTLRGLESLTSLTAVGNPFCLLARYRAATLGYLVALSDLDGRAVTTSERQTTRARGLADDGGENDAAVITITINTLGNVPHPRSSGEEDGVQKRQGYYIAFSCPGGCCEVTASHTTAQPERLAQPGPDLGLEVVSTAARPWRVGIDYSATFALSCVDLNLTKTAMMDGLCFSLFRTTSYGVPPPPADVKDVQTTFSNKKAAGAKATRRSKARKARCAAGKASPPRRAGTTQGGLGIREAGPAELRWLPPTTELLGTFRVAGTQALLDGMQSIAFQEVVVGVDGDPLTGMPPRFYSREATVVAGPCAALNKQRGQVTKPSGRKGTNTPTTTRRGGLPSIITSTLEEAPLPPVVSRAGHC